MRFLKKKVFSKMALIPMPCETSEEEPEATKISSPVKPDFQQESKPLPEIIIKDKPINLFKKEYSEDYCPYLMASDRQDMVENNTNTKNIVKNYGKAMCSFAASDLSLVYLKPLAEKENIKIDRFKEYFRCKKELVGSIESFRNLYIEDETDNEEIKKFKRIFKHISIVFMKYFSVNWIFNGKLTQKQAHLKYRFKILRRIKHPELFTYLKA